MRPRRAPALLAAAAALVACAGAPERGGATRTEVVVTTTTAADLVRNVAGDRAEVHTLLPPGADPHEYEPRPSDVAAAESADLVVESGGGVDAWAGTFAGPSGADRLVLSDAVGAAEPHWWQDPRLAADAVRAIRDRLAEADPDGANDYRRRASGYLAELRRLDREIARCIERVPPAGRTLVTGHDALRAFADRYRLEVAGSAIPARTSEAQPSAGETAELVERIRDEGVPAIFPERGRSTRLERAIADEAHVALGAPLYTDALGPPGSGADTYIRMMRANADALVRGLTGDARSCAST